MCLRLYEDVCFENLGFYENEYDDFIFFAGFSRLPCSLEVFQLRGIVGVETEEL